MPRGFILQPTYRIRGSVPVVQLYGRLEGGEPFLVEDDRFRPYLFAPPRAAEELAQRRGIRISETELCDLEGKPVVRIEVATPADVPTIRDRLIRSGVPALESDVRFPYRYLIDHDIRATLAIHGDPERVPLGPGAPDLLRFKNPTIEAADARPELTTLSIDIETTGDAKLVFAVALVGCGVEEVLLIGDRPVRGTTVVADEAELLRLTLERIRALDPDVLLGWAVVDFDLRVLASRAEAHQIPFFLGRADETVRFQRDLGFTRQSRAEVPGRMVLDGIPLVRDALRLPDYRLETVGQHVLGRGKKIDQSAPNKAQEIYRMWREDPESLAVYNLEDARLVPEILEHEGLLQLTYERSRLAGMQLDRVGASIASFDRVYLPELRRHGRVAPSVDSERKSARIQGGALLEPEPGIYHNVAVLDFKSLYPSLIRTFHLDPLAHARATDTDPAAPNGARFSRDEAILPGVIEHFMKRREAAKARGDRHADQAIKIMMNAMFGVLGAASCRFFDPDIANAITGFGQQTLHWTRDAFEETGHRVLYGDTDSVFVELPKELDALQANALAQELRARVETRIAERVRDPYQVEPQLVLELEKIFTRLMLPRVRGGRSGSKKRYAGWIGSRDDGELIVVGLESVRRDWPDIAHRLQQGMLERLFTDREVVPFVAELVEQVRAGSLDAELVYAKRLRKGALENYTTNAPHVVAARKLGGRPGSLIRYVITRRGPEPTPPGTAIPKDLDRSHYVEKVLRPVADAIFELTEHSFDEAIGNPTQLRLL
ncbi:MAG: DNA polymerase II [Deltaproteobacteria bacterium]|nr:DNA polymerase II [Deltaproteobacteria bacterium]